MGATTPGGAYCKDMNIADAVMLPITASQTFEAGAFVTLTSGKIVATPVDATGNYVKVTTAEFTKIYGIAMVSSYVGNKSAAHAAAVASLAVDTLIPVWKIDTTSEIELPVMTSVDGPPPVIGVGGGAASALTWATATYTQALAGANVLSGANPPAGGGLAIGSGLSPDTGVTMYCVGDTAPTTNGIFRVDRLCAKDKPYNATTNPTPRGRVVGTIYDVFIQ